MIEITDKGQIILEFGNGDIAIEGTQAKVTANNLPSKDVGILFFRNIKPQKIGTKPYDEDEVDIAESPVVMSFSRVESIDVVIKKLSQVKEIMIKNGVGGVV